MKCPKCRTEEMETAHFDRVVIDQCPACKGVFLDVGELVHALELKLGHVLDSLQFSPIAEQMDDVPAHCFLCGVDMVVSTGPAGLRLDKCPKCGGAFLDQGELATIQVARDTI
jgi:Zn-finger nucleic acid-binding protein